MHCPATFVPRVKGLPHFCADMSSGPAPSNKKAAKVAAQVNAKGRILTDLAKMPDGGIMGCVASVPSTLHAQKLVQSA